MNNYIHKIIDFFFHHEVSDEITERVYNRMVFPVEDKAREEAVSQIWDKLDDASCSDEKIEKAFYNLETSLGLKKEEQTVELVHREHIRNTKRINWGRVAAIWTIPFIMVCFSAYYYYSAKDYVKETLSEVTYMQLWVHVKKWFFLMGVRFGLMPVLCWYIPPVSYLNLAMFILREKVSLKFQKIKSILLLSLPTI